MDKILLHTCCAGCAFGVVETLENELSLKPTLFFYNPNIQPVNEYKSREDALLTFSKAFNLDYLILGYYPDEHTNFLDSFTPRPDRCFRCYTLRLSVTFLKALEEGFISVTTTLLSSPHQYHESIKEIGNYLSSFYKIPFFYHDFRASYYNYLNKYKELGYYHQKYCGCTFSMEGK